MCNLFLQAKNHTIFLRVNLGKWYFPLPGPPRLFVRAGKLARFQPLQSGDAGNVELSFQVGNCYVNLIHATIIAQPRRYCQGIYKTLDKVFI
jgi:hypothetical protein